MDEEIKKAIDVLRTGGTILYPTDTIWGIGCDATNEKAVEKVIAIKERKEEAPALKGEIQMNENNLSGLPLERGARTGGKSFVVLVSDEGMLNRFVKDVPAQAWDLIEVSDTPLTIIYDSGRGFAKNILAEDGSIGVRIVKDDFCQRLIHKFGKPLVSTSANISGTEAPQNYDEISEGIKSKIDYIANWRQDDFSKSKPSSIIKLKMNGEFLIVRK
ncbi:MAG: Sua5/YciO/YrdC/YwlC family protein [Bacteroidetes bacterium]|nr:Sua5/YciO/YrdC/YwlC family protein [Bacteroidota bacterium]